MSGYAAADQFGSGSDALPVGIFGWRGTSDPVSLLRPGATVDAEGAAGTRRNGREPR